MLEEVDGDGPSGFNPPPLVAKYAENRRRIGLGTKRGSTGEEPKADDTLLLRVTHTTMPIETVRCLTGFVAQLNTPLMHLSLSGTSLGSEGARLLGHALLTNNTLHVLLVDGCDLVGNVYRPDYCGLKALVKGIESARSLLQHLSVAQNDLQPEGCRLILGAAAFHRSLTALDISSNLLALFHDKQDPLALEYLLRFNKQLCWLDISGNVLPKSATAMLSQSLQGNSSLTSLHAAECELSLEQLRSSLEDNSWLRIKPLSEPDK